MLGKIARMTAVIGALAALGATSASAMDDDQVRAPSPGPTVEASGVYGYDSTANQWVVWDVIRLPNRQTQTRCHYAGNSGPTWAC